jgi:hypothetical protein
VRPKTAKEYSNLWRERERERERERRRERERERERLEARACPSRAECSRFNQQLGPLLTLMLELEGYMLSAALLDPSPSTRVSGLAVLLSVLWTLWSA